MINQPLAKEWIAALKNPANKKGTQVLTHMNTVTPQVVVLVQPKMVETQTSTFLATVVTAIFL